MPRVKLEGILEQLAPELRRALGSAVRELHPDLVVDDYALYRAFQRAARRPRGGLGGGLEPPHRVLSGEKHSTGMHADER